MRRAAPTLHGGAPRSPGQSRLRPESRARHVVQTVLRRDRGRGRGPTTPVRAGAAWSITGISSRMPRSACMTTATVTPQPELDGRLLHLSRVASCAQPSSLAARGGAPPRISDHRGLHRTRRGKGDSIVGGDVGDAAGTVTATSGVTACASLSSAVARRRQSRAVDQRGGRRRARADWRTCPLPGYESGTGASPAPWPSLLQGRRLAGVGDKCRCWPEP